MNGKIARKIRKEVLGEDLSPRFREYFRSSSSKSICSTIQADGARQSYQRAKKQYA